MIHVIRRKSIPQEEQIIEGGKKKKAQISYNSDHRLVVRVVHEDGGDILVVFDRALSSEIVSFCQEVLKGRERLFF